MDTTNPMKLELDIGAATDPGKVRDHNEDYFTTARFANGDLLVVCDGMGGHAAGDVASRIACSTIVASILPLGRPDPRDLLYDAAERAHEAVLAAAREAPGREGMGTTCVVAMVRNGQMYVGNVGDSRAYLLRAGEVRQVSIDHTKVKAMQDKGILSPEEAKTHPEAGVLYQAIGQKSGITPYVDKQPAGFELRAGDVVVLCSDGVYECMDDPTWVRLTSAGTAEEVAHTLIDYAITHDGKDNATAVVARALQGSRRALGSSGVAATVIDDGDGEPVAPVQGQPGTPAERQATVGSERRSDGPVSQPRVAEAAAFPPPPKEFGRTRTEPFGGPTPHASMPQASTKPLPGSARDTSPEAEDSEDFGAGGRVQANPHTWETRHVVAWGASVLAVLLLMATAGSVLLCSTCSDGNDDRKQGGKTKEDPASGRVVPTNRVPKSNVVAQPPPARSPGPAGSPAPRANSGQ